MRLRVNPFVLVAESFLLIYALGFRRDRIGDSLAETIQITIPNRVTYFLNQNLDLYPNGQTDIMFASGFEEPMMVLKAWLGSIFDD